MKKIFALGLLGGAALLGGCHTGTMGAHEAHAGGVPEPVVQPVPRQVIRTIVDCSQCPVDSVETPVYRPAPRKVMRPAPKPKPVVRQFVKKPVISAPRHVHGAGACVSSHAHPHEGQSKSHKHCLPGVKAKGSYRGPVAVDSEVMRQYQR